MTVVVEELIVTLSARLDQYQTQLNSMGRETDRRLVAIERRFDEFANRLQSSVSRAAMALTSSLGAALSTRELADYADTWTRVGRSIEGTQQIYGITLITAKEIAALAVRTRSDLDATSQLYNRTAIAVSKLGMDTRVAVGVTETFAKALKLGGATAAEQAAVMVQFSQALTKGKLDGDEFRSIMENAGVIQQALIEKFKVSGKGLMDMAEKGKITAKDIIAALQQIKPKVDAAFDKAPATLAESFTNLKTAIAEYVGSANSASGVTATLGAGMQALADNIDVVGKLAAVLGAGLLVAFGPGIIAAVAGMGAGLVSIPALLAGGAAAGYLFSDRITVIASAGVKLSDVFVAMGNITREAVGKSATYAADQLQHMANVLTAIFRLILDNPMADGIGTVMRIMVQETRDALNAIIGASKYAALSVAANVVDLFGALPGAITGALNAALQKVESFVNAVALLLNTLPGVKIDVQAVSLGRLGNDAIATQAATLRKQALDALSTDYIGKFTAAAGEVSTGIASSITGALASAGYAVLDRATDEAVKRRWSSGMSTTINRTPSPVYPDPPDKNKYTKDIESIKKKTEMLVAEAAAVGKTASEQERAKAMQELLTAAREAELAVTPQMLADMDALARAYGAAHARLDLLRKVQQTKEDTAATQREIALTGLYGYELHRARVEAELLADAKRSGTPLTEPLRQEIAQTAAANAATKQLADTLNAVRDTSQSALKSFISDLREGKSGAEALSGAISKIADKLVDMAANQLVEAALGTALKGANGGSGGGMLKLFGFADGGVMTPAGPRGLNRYASGGVSRTAAVFAEAGPEAAVPLPDGRRIPVELRMPNITAAMQATTPAASAGVGAVNVNPVFNLSGGVTAADLAAVKAQVAAELPRAVSHGINTAFDRQARFRRSGI